MASGPSRQSPRAFDRLVRAWGTPGQVGPCQPGCQLIRRCMTNSRATKPDPSRKFLDSLIPGRAGTSRPASAVLCGPGDDRARAAPRRRPPHGRAVQRREPRRSRAARSPRAVEAGHGQADRHLVEHPQHAIRRSSRMMSSNCLSRGSPKGLPRQVARSPHARRRHPPESGGRAPRAADRSPRVAVRVSICTCARRLACPAAQAVRAVVLRVQLGDPVEHGPASPCRRLVPADGLELARSKRGQALDDLRCGKGVISGNRQVASSGDLRRVR